MPIEVIDGAEIPVLVASWNEVFTTCEQDIRYAQQTFAEELAKRWPIGTEISFWYTSHAKNCTVGEVVGHSSTGRVHVRLNTVNRRGNRTLKRVPWRNIS